MKTTNSLLNLKQNKQKFSAVTAYDATFTKIINKVGIDVILVGDSLGNVIQGQTTTVPVTVEQMIYHTQCVSRANTSSLLIADLPYMSYTNCQDALSNASKLMQAGADMVKMEGGTWLAPITQYLTERGIPVCAHLGLTPQTVHALGGFKVQGRDPKAADDIFHAAKLIQDAGATLMVLECIPDSLAADITHGLAIPVIGIGAGNSTDGQILVLHDLLGLNESPPKFVKNFLKNTDSIEAALAAYHQAVVNLAFPSQEHSFNS